MPAKLYPQHGYGVYAITNKVNGKRYIGACNCANSRMAIRKSQHLTGNKRGNAGIREDLKTYNRDDFTFDVLAYNMTEDEAHHLESELIKDLQPR